MMLDVVKRKMLRQNRELARINSTQAIRLRQLEAECARMLSENLELRSVILRMETEAENNKAARIADQALEIKAKLEAQLAGFGDLLANLGSEPPAKRQSLSPGSRKIATPKSASRRRSASHKVLRDMAKEAEARAREEGRLTPIIEHTTYPRISQGPEELLSAQQQQTCKTSLSPALGSPPSSHFIDDALLVETPTKKPTNHIQVRSRRSHSSIDRLQEPTQPPTVIQSPKSTTTPTTTATRNLVDNCEPAPTIIIKTGKRKHGNELSELSRSSDSERESSLTRASSIRDKTKGKNLKELAALRREAQEKQTEVPEISRKPLSAKSTNKDLTMSRQVAKENIKNDKNMPAAKPDVACEKEKPSIVREHSRSHNREQIQPICHAIEPVVSTPKRLETVAIVLDDDQHVGDDSDLMGTKSPEPQHIEETSRLGDTPPPSHISSNGETSRPSRRSRAAVSYAEPNLRDKMRRPTKELFDAVAGEGKYMRRSSSSKQDIAMPEMISKPQGTSKLTVSAEPAGCNDANTSQVPDTSSLVEATKTRDEEFLPSSVVIERRKRRSSTAWEIAPDTAVVSASAPLMQERTNDVDLYEFTISSPSATLVSEKRPANRRRASAAVASGGYAEGESEKPVRASRKRATMAAPKRTRADMESSVHDESEGSQTDGSGIAVAPRTKAAIRRKSTLM
ncbi:Shugoshin [Ceratocystis fimbriata CBS 114723]|uniref:Shugoshin n=1 Tax=Ceratocystis fimbriata CBS 114723 TaxID=1035309 RepID=A0A2C5X1B0_9PEZI|nr:Shugoshin [Ceratocystis fimbriata CBS 114723]